MLFKAFFITAFISAFLFVLIAPLIGLDSFKENVFVGIIGGMGAGVSMVILMNYRKKKFIV